MKVIYNKEIYNVHWPKKFNVIVRKVAKDYKQSNGFISWKQAEADGVLRELPSCLTLRDLSHRWSHLKRRGTKKFKDRRKVLNEKCQKRKNGVKRAQFGINFEKVHLFVKIIPDETKRKHGWRPRSIWTDEQNAILNTLVGMYQKGKCIDWAKLVKNKIVRKLPIQSLEKLRKHYYSWRNQKDPVYLKKRRKAALEYKHNNYKAYRVNQDKRRKQIQSSVNEFLLSQL